MNADKIPAELRALRQWLVWRYEPGKKKPRKVPYYINAQKRQGTQGSPEDRAGLGTFEQAVKLAKSKRFDGIGLAMLPEAGLIGVDLDHCIKDGEYSDTAKEFLADFTYAETSPSGNGLRLFYLGTGVDKKNHKAGVESFHAKGFLTITGNRINGTDILAMRPERQARLHELIGAQPTAAEPKLKAIVATPADIAALLGRLREALKFLQDDADDREFWLRAGWAIGRDTGQSQEGFELWLEWAAQSSAHDAARDPKHMRVEYFQKSAEPRDNPVTTATIFQRACAAGWRPARPCTDLGNAERLADAGEGKLKYCPQLDCWLAWDGGRWRVDEDGVALRVAKAVTRGIYAEAQAEPDADRRAKLARWAVAAEGAGRLRAAVELARSDLRLIVSSIALDSDPMLLGVRNGVLDLRTGALLPATPEHYITRQANVAFDPSARCPLWEEVINRIFAGDAELIAYLQRATGYMLTGDARERLFFFLYGEHTGTGKTTFSSTLLELWGDYAVRAKSEILMRATTIYPGRPQPEILALRGARLVIATELSDEQRFDEEQLKDLVGGMDIITARTLHSAKMQAFIPTFKLLMYGNQKPRMRADDDAIWSRLHLIPFIHEVPRAERDKTLPEKLRREFPGILNWALAGLAAWQRAGILDAPKAVSAASEGYRNEQDTMGQFLEEGYLRVAGAWAWGGSIYVEYQFWCKDHGFRPVNNNRFAAALKAKGYERKEINGRAKWLGLGSKARRSPDGVWEWRSASKEEVGAVGQ